MTDKTAIRSEVIKAAIPQLANGVSTEIIAASYGITGRTLRNWLISDPDAEQARADYLTAKLMDATDAIDDAQDVFPLARAREQFKAWSWIAERRLPSRFASKNESNNGVNIQVNIVNPNDTTTVQLDNPLNVNTIEHGAE